MLLIDVKKMSGMLLADVMNIGNAFGTGVVDTGMGSFIGCDSSQNVFMGES